MLHHSSRLLTQNHKFQQKRFKQTTVPGSTKQVPLLGLGTWKSEPGQVQNAVTVAIKNGYRHIDCAHIYGNEKEVGKALKEVIQDGIVKREELWITSKLWNSDHHPDDVKPAVEITLKNLMLDYLDLYLIHWPMALAKVGDATVPKDDRGNVMVTYQDPKSTWGAMENLVDDDLVKFIGLSNFNRDQVLDIKKHARINPTFLQVECHPYLPQRELRSFCDEQGLILEAYSPLGSPDSQTNPAPDAPIPLLQNPIIKEIADKHQKNPGQILIRFHLERNHIVLAKSITDSRIISNLDSLNFTLDDSDMTKLYTLENNWRACPFSNQKLHPFYPF